MVKILQTGTLEAEDGTKIGVRIVADEGCPHCGEAGHPKVWDRFNVCWWKCYTEICDVAFYQPESNRVELRKN
jgi:hypothetical protein